MQNHRVDKSTENRFSDSLRSMEAWDIEQVLKVEGEAFPELRTPSPFKRELNSHVAHILVSERRVEADEECFENQEPNGGDSLVARSILHRFLRQVFGGARVVGIGSPPSQDRLVTGYVNTWYMGDEAHITAIGVLERLRVRGIGELLVIGAIESSLVRKARVVTLEARISNNVAQSLYSKYGFKEVGLRKRYYSDNNEDAVIMTTNNISEESYIQRFKELIEQHGWKWGISDRVITQS